MFYWKLPAGCRTGLAVLLGLTLVGCGSSTPSGSPSAPASSAASAVASTSFAAASATAPAGALPSDTLVVAVPATPPSIDLDLNSGPMTWLMALNVTARGEEYARGSYPFTPVPFADPGQIPGYTFPNFDLSKATPGIIQSCDLAADGKTATYHLRQGVKSAAGNEFTSADVMWRIQRALALKGNGQFFLSVANAADSSQWSAVDKYTVQITSATAMPLICSINVHLFWAYFDSVEAKKHATSDDPWATKWMDTHGTSFGAYEVTDWQAGKQVVMEANPNYYGGAPAIKKIIWQVVPDESGRLSLLKGGKVDIAESLSPDDIVSLKGVAGLRLLAQRGPTGLWAVMNNAKAPFDKVLVRQAINTAMPRADIVNNIYLGMGNQWQGTNASVFAAAGFIERHDYDFDLAKAKQLLVQAGYANGFETTLSYSAGDPVLESVAILIQSTLQKIGVTVTLQKLPSATDQQLVMSGKADFALWSDAAYLPDAQFTSQVTYTIANFQNYDSSKVAPLIDAGKSIVDPQQRIAYFQKVQTQEYQDAPLAWIAEPDYMTAISSRVVGFGTDCFPVYDVFRMSLK